MEKDLEKKFPSYFANFEMPIWAREQELVVFRACKSGKVDEESFQNTYVENGNKVPLHCTESDPSAYSLSVYTKLRDLKRFMTMTNEYGEPFIIARGITMPEYGICLATKEWKTLLGERYRSSHVDWWLYEGATPWQVFEEVSQDEIGKYTSTV